MLPLQNLFQLHFVAQLERNPALLAPTISASTPHPFSNPIA
jgi:hypothetical protein